MLEHAVKYKSEIEQKYINNVVGNDIDKYWVNDSYWGDGPKDRTASDWNYIRRVSVDKKGVVGYFTASVDRACNNITGLGFVKFDMNKVSITFVRDMKRFIDMLLIDYKFNKISFNVVIGNPAERLYDAFIQKHNGRIIGIEKKDTKLIDGLYYDNKLYEILREDYKE